MEIHEMSRNTDHNTDLEYIREKFSSDGIKAPESLSEDKIMEMIAGIEPDMPAASETSSASQSAGGPSSAPAGGEHAFTPAAPKKKRPLRKWAAAAACALVALIGVTQVFSALNAPPRTDIVDGELYTFESESEINKLVKSLSGSGSRRLFSGHDLIVEDTQEMSDAMEAGDSAMAPKAASGNSTGAASDHSDTYLQVEEVDEADIVKTDGKYIYYVSDSREVIIMSASKGETERLSVIGSQDIENYVEDIYLKGDILVTVGRVYDEDDGYAAVVTYDISDRSSPKLISAYRQSGDVVSSRMVGDNVYLVTSDYVYEGGRILPRIYSDGKYSDMAPSDICCVPEPKQSSYIVLGAVDISSGKEGRSKTHAIFGASQDIYCNDHNLYVTASEWNDKGNTTYTRIVRAKLDGLRIKFDATTKVRGYVNDQFSMDEKDGYFRIATTSQRDGMDVNNLFVLDSSLKETGKLTGFARNESIRSVRFFGEKAYVITYEQIDPLFIIDLSSPAEPKIDGEVKIDGFSTLLIPAGEGRLLGIGHATGDNGYGGQYASGLKLVLFDISDPSAPAVLDSREFENMDSPAQSTHKALTVNTRDGWYAIPYGVWHYNDIGTPEDNIIIEEDGPVQEDSAARAEEETQEDILIDDGGISSSSDTYEAGVLVFGADDSLEIYDQHKLGTQYLARSVYIDDYIYALDDKGNVSSFRFEK